jgi:hypothetical protein
LLTSDVTYDLLATRRTGRTLEAEEGDSMAQRRTNVAVFSFLGVILGIVLAGVAGYGAITEVVLAMIAGGLFGAVVGANWTTAPAPDQRRSRMTSK